MDQTGLLITAFAFAIGHGSFLAVTLLISLRKSGNRLLGVILILLIVRVGKSILTLLIPDSSYFVSSIGLVAMTVIGPLLVFYFESLFASTFSWSNKKYIHFCAMAGGLAACFTGDWRVLNVAYYVFTSQLLLYIVYTAFSLYKNATIYRSDDIKWKWSLGIMWGISLIAITFVLQLFIYDRFLYGLNVIISAVVLYCLSLWAARQVKLFLPDVKRKNDDADNLNELSAMISSLFEGDEIFIDPSLNITKLAKRLNTQPYLVSKAINRHFRKSFPEFLAGYRIRRAEQMLISSIGKTFTIEAVAYESGFSTLSAFYTSFKKINKMTPSQFRRRRGNADMKVA
jgi:AraC-like DNA-binding protein